MEKQQLADVIQSKQSLDMTEKEYRDYPAINYSTLSTLDRDPSLVNADFKQTDPMILGSLVDNLITRGEYGDEYKVASFNKPSGQMGEFCQLLIDGFVEQTAYEMVGFKRDKLLTVMDKFNSGDGVNYCNEVKENKDKVFVSFDTISKASRIVEVLRTHVHTAHYFTKNVPAEIELKYQVPIVFDLPDSMGEGKALFDLLVINHETQEIVPVDLKTTSSKTSEFKSSFMKWRYYLQSSLYSYGLKSISKYKVDPFEFVVISTTDSGKPLVWKCTNRDLIVGENGGTSPSGYKVKGFKELAMELIWHRSSDLWEYPMDVYTTNGFMELDNFAHWT